jgi:hypothetical protein
MFNAKLKTWVLCRTIDGIVHYWGSKKGYVSWVTDLSQATHFADLRSAKSKMSYCVKSNSYYSTSVNELFLGEIDATVQVKEIK